MKHIDLNADVGERPGADGLRDDALILDQVTSANVACGFHAGDAATMRALCDAAVVRGVRIGAHVGYDDRPGFGRRDLDVRPQRLRDETIYQLGALTACARAAGGRLTYLKPHGALYTRCARDPAAAAAVVDAADTVDPPLAILGPPASHLLAAAATRGLPTTAEGFADRGYLPDGRLVPRTDPGSLLDAQQALAQAEQIARAGQATAADGSQLALRVGSLCVHSDTPGAAELARALRRRFEHVGIELRPFS